MDSSVPRSGGTEQSWKVGALAEATGLTVRALHYYDHVGLLTPSGRTGAGHRVYSADDVARLYRITLLRRLGFPLAQIASVLDDPQWQLPDAVQRHLDHTRRRAAAAARLSARLAKMAAELDRRHDPASGELLSALEEMIMPRPARRSSKSPSTSRTACASTERGTSRGSSGTSTPRSTDKRVTPGSGPVR